MDCYTFRNGSLSQGFATMQDEKFGTIVFLGESGRGREYQKISLDRRNPATVVENRIIRANPKPITINQGTTNEKTFYVLECPTSKDGEEVLLRINTEGVYTKGSVGSWQTMAGNPVTLVKGYGAEGLAGRCGTWYDGLVTMQKGDVIKAKPHGGYKTSAYAIYFDKEGKLSCMKWEEYEVLQAIESGAKSAWQTEISYNDGIESRSREAMLLFVKKDHVVKFDGKDIEGVCTILKHDYTKSGRWSNTTYQISHNPEYAPKPLRQSWDNGRFIDHVESLAVMASQIGCSDVEEGVLVEFLKATFPKTWERYEELQASLNATKGWTETTFSNGKIDNRTGCMNLFVDAEKWDGQDISGKLVVTNRDHFDGRGGGGTKFTLKVAPGVQLERMSDKDIAEKKALEQATETGLPESLMIAFGGNTERVQEFMAKVEKLDAYDLDEHTICVCGRAKVESHLIKVSGDQYFFCGADPKEVVGYVIEIFFGTGDYSQDEEDVVEQPEDNTEGEPITADHLAALKAQFAKR